MGKLRQSNADRFRGSVTGFELYEQLKDIEVYKNHRESLRPWDRPLPAIVEQEANRRALWIMKPPSSLYIAAVFVICVTAMCLIGSIPFAINEEALGIVWKNLSKPSIVYHDARVLFAISIVCHACTGMSLWMIFLAEGFSKHVPELCPIAFTILLDCIWADVTFSALRLDWTLMIWCAILIFSFIAIVLLILRGVMVAALFMVPQLCGTMVVIAYVSEFYKLHGPYLPVY